MTIQDLIDLIGAMEGVLVLQPQPGDGSPEIAWGDVFFYYAPDGVVPKTQPFATIITKDYPGDDACRLDRPGAFRLNIATRAPAAREPRDDTVIVHPVYGRQGWVAIVNPGPATAATAVELLCAAHQRASSRRKSPH
ncbi:hypothetical protein MMAG44476_31702 [Mycolicibacterium mageritense DSM 44476 = CIP 104973]|uniref:DUF6194 domain-containing protein n=1 Tax=Mycolicibacterium mageritense TaxID=53462 RepID=A0ABM7HW14_MYCME|nr:DUF6194 family protein [Mycolicibacterium mageritense]MCC9183857.1 DUF6194 family protein [Mycolicibacterium mageritense]BBX34794.1 hypothetical protein MMAGJ_40760 [Mycolicibacterium mageritense]CDO20687.1 hypothetical protein BN978_01144 [Mycolicibacterium mageritense DSM 44476 = CIP 104973]